MTTGAVAKMLGAEALQQFAMLQADAVNAVTARFYSTHGSLYEQFGARGREACREDLAFHLEFMRPVLEFGLLQPMVDYLCWLRSVLSARGIPAAHLALSLDWLAEFFVSRMASADGAIITAAFEAARTQYLDAALAPAAPPLPCEPWPETAAFVSALLAGKQREARSIVDRCIDSGHGLVDVELHVIQPALYEIGEKWQTNQVSVAQEHLATAIAQSVMTAGLLRSPAPLPLNKRALLACVDGNKHDVGLRMVADALQLAGWDTHYLGANVPTSALVQHVAESAPDLVGLSVSFPQQLRVVKAIIKQLDERLGSTRPPVMIGGLAINRFSSLAGVTGADAFRTDSLGAVGYAERIAKRRVEP